MDELAQRIDTNATWEDLILPEKEKQVLQECYAQVKQRVFMNNGVLGTKVAVA